MNNPKKEFTDSSFEISEDYFGRGASDVPEKFGLCSSCSNFLYILYQHNKEISLCTYDELLKWPREDNPIIKCSRYNEKGKLSLMEMANMATYIEVDKNKIGFNNE